MMNVFTSPSTRGFARSQENEGLIARKPGAINLTASARKPLAEKQVNMKDEKEPNRSQQKAIFAKTPVKMEYCGSTDDGLGLFEETVSLQPIDVNDLDSDVFLMDHPRITRQDIYNSIKNRMRTPSPTFSVSSPLPFIEHKDSFFEYDSMEDSGIKMDFMELDDVMVPEFELSDDNDDGDAIY